MRWTFGFAAVTFAAIVSLGQASPPERRFHTPPSDVRAAATLPLTPPMRANEWERSLAMLQLSDPQRKYALDLRASFAPMEDEREKKRNDLWRKSGEAYERAMNDFQGVIADEERRFLVVACERINDQLANDEKILFDAIERTLADEQLSLLGHVNALRTRRRSLDFITGLPGAEIDQIEDIFLALQERGVGLHPLDAEAWEALWTEYDGTVTPLLVQLREAGLRSSVEGEACLRESLELQRTRSTSQREAAVRALREKRREANHPVVRQAKHLEAVQRAYTESFANHLPEEEGRLWLNAFQALAYPALFPWPYDLPRALREIQATAESEAADGADLIDMIRLKQTELKELEDRMRQTNVAWRLEAHRNSGFEPEKYQAYQRRMAEMQERRFALADEAFRVLEGALGDQGDILSKHRKELAHVREAWVPRLTPTEGDNRTLWPHPYK